MREWAIQSPVSWFAILEFPDSFDLFYLDIFDKVLYKDQECFINGRRATGSFSLTDINGEVINAGILYKKLKLLECFKTFIIGGSGQFLPGLKPRVSLPVIL